MKLFNIPRVVSEEFGFSAETEEKKDKDELSRLFKEGDLHYPRVLPDHHDSRRSNTLFCNFGTALENVVLEFNRFCDGSHPCYNGRNGCPLVRFDGSKGSKSMGIEDEKNKGYFVRISPDTDNCALVLGNFGDPSLEGVLEYVLEGQIVEGRVTLSRTASNISVAITEKFLVTASLAMRNDWTFWNASGQRTDCGKVMLIDSSDYSVRHIFFEDSIEVEEAKVVDVRDVITGKCCPSRRPLISTLYGWVPSLRSRRRINS